MRRQEAASRLVLRTPQGLRTPQRLRSPQGVARSGCVADSATLPGRVCACEAGRNEGRRVLDADPRSARAGGGCGGRAGRDCGAYSRRSPVRTGGPRDQPDRTRRHRQSHRAEADGGGAPKAAKRGDRRSRHLSGPGGAGRYSGPGAAATCLPPPKPGFRVYLPLLAKASRPSGRAEGCPQEHSPPENQYRERGMPGEGARGGAAGEPIGGMGSLAGGAAC